MKTHRKNQSRAGFTLMELMVAMAITTIIVTVLVSITSIATDTWNRSRAELRAMRQGKAMVESMARDFEALVVRKGNEFEWLSAETPSSMPGGSGGNLESSNACDLIFFTGSGGVYHVGLYVGMVRGHRWVLHAPYSGTRVRAEPLWTDHWFAGTLRYR